MKSNVNVVFDQWAASVFNASISNGLLEADIAKSILLHMAEAGKCAHEDAGGAAGFRGVIFQIDSFPVFLRRFLLKNFCRYDNKNKKYHFYYKYSYRANTNNVYKISKEEFLKAKGGSVVELTFEPLEQRADEGDDDYVKRLLDLQDNEQDTKNYVLIVAASANAKNKAAVEAIDGGKKLSECGLENSWSLGIENYTTMLARWLKGKNTITRDNLLKLSFILGLERKQTEILLAYGIMESGFNLRNAQELTAFFLQSHAEFNSFQNFCDVMECYNQGEKEIPEFAFDTPKIREILLPEKYDRCVAHDIKKISTLGELKHLLNSYRDELVDYSRHAHEALRNEIISIIQKIAEDCYGGREFDEFQDTPEGKQRMARVVWFLDVYRNNPFSKEEFDFLEAKIKEKQIDTDLKNRRRRNHTHLCPSLKSWYDFDKYIAKLSEIIRSFKNESERSLVESRLQDTIDVFLEQTNNDYYGFESYFIRSYSGAVPIFRFGINFEDEDDLEYGDEYDKYDGEDEEIEATLDSQFSGMLEALKSRLLNDRYVFNLMIKKVQPSRQDVIAMRLFKLIYAEDGEVASPVGRVNVLSSINELLKSCNFAPLNLYNTIDMYVLISIALGAYMNLDKGKTNDVFMNIIKAFEGNYE